jgi:hypothetical protein
VCLHLKSFRVELAWSCLTRATVLEKRYPCSFPRAFSPESCQGTRRMTHLELRSTLANVWIPYCRHLSVVSRVFLKELPYSLLYYLLRTHRKLFVLILTEAIVRAKLYAKLSLIDAWVVSSRYRTLNRTRNRTRALLSLSWTKWSVPSLPVAMIA